MADTTTAEPEDRLGMTDAQWAQWQAYTHGYGEQDANGIDISLIRGNLRLTPWERLGNLQRNVLFFKKDFVEQNREQKSDFQQVIAALSAAGLRFVIVGGIAMRLHGSAYITDDIDFAFARDANNLEALVKALAAYHPTLRGIPPGLPFFWNMRSLKNLVNMTLQTDLGSVDLLGALAGIASFEALWARSFVVDLGGAAVHVASVDDLIAMKTAANRPKDQNHVMELRALKALIASGDPAE